MVSMSKALSSVAQEWSPARMSIGRSQGVISRSQTTSACSMAFTILADAVRQFLLFGIQRTHMVVSKQLLTHEDGGDRGLQLVGDGGDEGGLCHVELVELGDMSVSMPTTTALTLRVLYLLVSPPEVSSGGVGEV